MKVPLTAAMMLAGALVWASSAIAADQTVRASGGVPGDYGWTSPVFSPSTVRIVPGDTVTFVNDSGTHNVRFQDGLFTSPSTPMEPAGWPSPPASRTFSQAGSFAFSCDLHAASGMTGTVIVGTSTTTPTPSPGQPGSPTTSPAALRIESLSLPRRRFCNRRGPRCRRPGVRFQIDLSRAGRVTGTLRRRALRGRRRARRFGRLEFGEVKPGKRTLSFRRTTAGRRLTSGRYVLTLKAGEDTGVLRFSVVG